MKGFLRWLGIAFLLALLWPELQRYAAEYRLAQAAARLDRALSRVDQGQAAMDSVVEAQRLTNLAGIALPGDARPVMLEGIALILSGQSQQAIAVLEAGIAQGERPEFTLNLGRARAAAGDEAGARAAFLRSGWASPTALGTLPKPVRESLLLEIQQLDSELRAGRLQAPPPL
jgi:tetratricopeptide (TPR) repeat protein